ncbi:MAG: HipA domain-containing protein [Bacteroidota bacterium]
MCPGCFASQAEEGFCKKCLRELFDSRKVSHLLPFSPPSKDTTGTYNDLTKHLSISGVRIKYSMKLEGVALTLTETGGHYILKPIPVGQFLQLDQAPANEHLTMQIAKQLFKISVPANAMLRFNDGSPAYLVRRFDVKKDNSKYQQEDFAQIAGVTEDTNGKNYKYDLTYEEIGDLIKKYIPMYKVEAEKFLRLVIFNYVFSNGDAHARNFSIIRSDDGDYLLTPAYDLLCTKIHTPQETEMALHFFKDGSFSPAFQSIGYYTSEDFLLLGRKLEIKDERTLRIIQEFKTDRKEVHDLIDKSFLNNTTKALYHQYYSEKVKRLNHKS